MREVKIEKGEEALTALSRNLDFIYLADRIIEILEQSESQGSAVIKYSVDSRKDGLRGKKLKCRNNDQEELKHTGQEIMRG